MTVPPSKPGNITRAALAARLTELRAAAGLSGNALAKQIGVVQSRVWKIEHGTLLPTEDDIEAWAQASGAGAEVAGKLLAMLAEARTEQAFSAVFRTKGGPAAYQDRIRQIEARSARIGEFQVAVIPGLLQTAAYAREVVSLPGGVRAWGPDDADVEAMIGARLRRQEVLYDQGKHIQAVISEAALRILVTSPETLIGQLDKLLAVIRLPSVELGVIGLGQRVPAYTLGGFRIYDDDLIIVESIAGEREFTPEADPAEVMAFLAAFDALRQAASTGSAAAAIIQRALDDLHQS